MRHLRKAKAIEPFSHFNPRTPYGMRQALQVHSAILLAISIHAPHTGCDGNKYENQELLEGISIHAPHTGCDRGALYRQKIYDIFQSTHPIRDATLQRYMGREN